MRVLVTGSTGFVGRHLLRAWKAQAPELDLYGVAREGQFEEFEEMDAASLFRADVRDAKAVGNVCRTVQPDAVVHLAAQAFVPASMKNPRETWDINCWGALNLLEALRESGFRGRFLAVGSGDQYGHVETQELPITEQQPLRPRNPYAASKAAAELMCYQYGQTYGFEVVRARPFNHIGPGQSPQFAIADFCRQVARIELGLQPPVLSVGNLEVSRDFLDVRDVVDAYYCLLKEGKAGEVYNVCSAVETRLSAMVHTLIGFSSREIVVQVDETRARPADTPRVRGSYDQLARHTGWRPKRNLEECMKDVFAYWLEKERT